MISKVVNMSKSLTIYKLHHAAYRLWVNEMNIILDDSDLEMLRALNYKINMISAVSAGWSQ